ncbi:MAG TPA: DinB family protein [Pseudonocardiaceae bacterium]
MIVGVTALEISQRPRPLPCNASAPHPPYASHPRSSSHNPAPYADVCYPLTQAGRIRDAVPMPAEYAQTDQFRGARIHLCDLGGLEIRDCDVSGLKIVDCYGANVYLGGAFERLVVNDIDVTAYVEAELDRQNPTRPMARDAESPDDYRVTWDAIETHWEATLDRARLLPEAKLHEQVDGEWSFVETQRHLLMGGDSWLGNAVLEEDAPYHPLGLPYGGMPPEAVAKLGLSLDADPTLDEVLAQRRARMATMRRVVDGLTVAELDRVCGRKPTDSYPDRDYVVRHCVKVVLKEEVEHHRYAVRDLAVLEAGA